VPVKVARRTHRPDARAAELAQWLFRESDRAGQPGAERVERVVDVTIRIVAVDGRLANLVRMDRTARVLQRTASGSRNGDREAGVRADKSGDLPTAHDCVDHRVPVLSERTAFADGQFISARPNKVVRRIEERRAVVVAVTVVLVS